MKKKNVTIEDLAVMVQKGFLETAKKSEVNRRFEEIEDRFDDVKARFEGVNRRFDAIDDRLDRIEKILLADHKKRIEKLEADIKDLRGLLSAK